MHTDACSVRTPLCALGQLCEAISVSRSIETYLVEGVRHARGALGQPCVTVMGMVRVVKSLVQSELVLHLLGVQANPVGLCVELVARARLHQLGRGHKRNHLRAR